MNHDYYPGCGKVFYMECTHYHPGSPSCASEVPPPLPLPIRVVQICGLEHEKLFNEYFTTQDDSGKFLCAKCLDRLGIMMKTDAVEPITSFLNKLKLVFAGE